MTEKRPILYYLLGFLFIGIGLYITFDIAFTSKLEDIVCQKGGFFDCESVLKYESSFLTLPASLWGMGFYLISALYFLFPTLNPNNENYLKGMYFGIVVIACIIDLILLGTLIFVYKTLCVLCITTYICNFGLLFLIYFYDIRPNGTINTIKSFFTSFFKNELHQKEVIFYSIFSLLVFSILFFYNQNRQLHAKFTNPQNTANQIIEDSKLKGAVDAFYHKDQIQFILDNLPYLGEKNSPISMVVFFDIQCPGCQAGYYDIKKLVQKYNPKLRVTFYHFPFQESSYRSDYDSMMLAQFCQVAYEENKYFEYLEAVFDLYNKKIKVDKAQLEQIFKNIGIDIPFSEIESRANKVKDVIEKQVALGDALGIEYTPAIYINGRYTARGHNQPIIDAILQRELANLNDNKVVQKPKNDPILDKNLAKRISKEIQNFEQQPKQDYKTDDLPYLGKEKSPIELLVFHEPQCPICQKSFFELKEMIKNYYPLVKASFCDYPFKPSGKHSQLNSFQLSQYAQVAYDEGRYFPFIETLFKLFQDDIYIDKSKIEKIFKDIHIGISFEEIEKRLNKKSEFLNKNIQLASRLKVNSTPTLFLNGKLIDKGHVHTYLEAVVKNEISKLERRRIIFEKKEPAKEEPKK